MKNLLVLVQDVALNNSSRTNTYRLAAAIVKKNEILGIGVNNYKKTHPLQAKYGKNPLAVYPCAEVCSIINAKKRYSSDDLRGSTIYVARGKWSNAFKESFVQGFAKPCVGCQKHIEELGIKRVVYTDNDTRFICEEV